MALLKRLTSKETGEYKYMSKMYHINLTSLDRQILDFVFFINLNTFSRLASPIRNKIKSSDYHDAEMIKIVRQKIRNPDAEYTVAELRYLLIGLISDKSFFISFSKHSDIDLMQPKFRDVMVKRYPELKNNMIKFLKKNLTSSEFNSEMKKVTNISKRKKDLVTADFHNWLKNGERI